MTTDVAISSPAFTFQDATLQATTVAGNSLMAPFPGPELADKELAQTELIMVQFGPAQPKSTLW